MKKFLVSGIILFAVLFYVALCVGGEVNVGSWQSMLVWNTDTVYRGLSILALRVAYITILDGFLQQHIMNIIIFLTKKHLINKIELLTIDIVPHM